MINRAWLYLLPTLVVMTICAIIPLFIVVNYSVQDSFAGDHFFWVGLHWFEDTMRSSSFWASLGRTALFSMSVIAIQFSVGIFVARKLFYKHRKAGFFIVAFSVPMLTPWIVVGFSWRLMLDANLGPLSAGFQLLGFMPDLNGVGWSWFAIILMDVWHWTGLVIVLAYAGYLSIPANYFQAALIDGANSWRTFRYVELPKLRRVLIIAFLLRFMDSFMVYTEPFMVTRGGPDVATTFLSLDLVQTASIQFDLGKAGAMSVIYIVAMIVVCWFLFQAIHTQSNEKGARS